MDATSDGFPIQIANDLSEVARITARLQPFGRAHKLPEMLVNQFMRALDELAADSVQHGLSTLGHETIRIGITLDTAGLGMEVSDPGRAFDPLRAAGPQLPWRGRR